MVQSADGEARFVATPLASVRGDGVHSARLLGQLAETMCIQSALAEAQDVSGASAQVLVTNKRAIGVSSSPGITFTDAERSAGGTSVWVCSVCCAMCRGAVCGAVCV